MKKKLDKRRLVLGKETLRDLSGQLDTVIVAGGMASVATVVGANSCCSHCDTVGVCNA